MSRSRNFLFTLNNWEIQEYNQLETMTDYQYLIIGKEVGAEGTPHLQGYVHWNNQKTLKAVMKINPKIHWEICKGTPQQNITYCSKDNNFEEWGTKPMSQEDKGERGKAAIAGRWELAKEGRFEELPPEQIKTYEYIFRRYTKVQDRDILDNQWIMGPSGCGKSRSVREQHPPGTFYQKTMNKWWDGYNGEEVVVLDDFDPRHAEKMAYYVKTWMDHYVIHAEVKGGMIQIRPKTLIVTSQYTMAECFKEERDLEAISRRFTVKDMGMCPPSLSASTWNKPPPLRRQTNEGWYIPVEKIE